MRDIRIVAMGSPQTRRILEFGHLDVFDRVSETRIRLPKVVSLRFSTTAAADRAHDHVNVHVDVHVLVDVIGFFSHSRD